MKIDYSELYGLVKGTDLEPWTGLLPERIAHGLRYERHGLLPQWEEVLAGLPTPEEGVVEATSPPLDRGSDVPVAYIAQKKHRTNFFNPHEQTTHLSGNLPHWRQDGCMYFVTFRLADALPARRLSMLREEKNTWLRLHPPPPAESETYFAWKDEYRRLFEDRIDEWLDAGHGGCLLGNSAARKVVENALLHFDGERYRLDSFVVMPNHVHVLVASRMDYSLSDIVKGWKSYTGHELVKQFGATAPVWQKEYFDHIVRSPESLEKFRNYIAENPQRLVRVRDGDVASTNRQQTSEVTSPSPGANRVELKSEVRVDGPHIEGLEVLLKQFHPWRKGPYHVHGVHIDTEWRSDWKWDRVGRHLQPLEGRTVLDVGCGNGYHCWRMAGEGARLAIGIDPSPIYVCQFFAMKHFIRNPRAWVLPLAFEDLPAAPGAFDTVFSMGVLYHRKDPMEHIEQLKTFLKPHGELVIETLVVDGPDNYALKPKGRYAKMRNVHSIPSVPTLEAWLRQGGFNDVRTVDVTTTTSGEQRSTEWMTFESLSDFLDPADPTQTVEGHSAPMRAIVIASFEGRDRLPE